MPDSGKANVDLLTLFSRWLMAAVVVAALGLLGYDVFHQVTAIAPITATPATAGLGLTADVAARHLHDELAAIASGADGVRRPNLSLDGQTAPLTLPVVGLSIDTVAASIRGLFSIRSVRQVSGDFTEAHGLVWLRLRVDDVLVYQTAQAGVDPAHAQQELNTGARMVARDITPYIYAAYLHHVRDAGETDALRQIVADPATPKPVVAETQRLWGQILAEQQDWVDAMAHYDAAAGIYQILGWTAEQAELQNYVGQAYVQSGDYGKARDAYRQVLVVRTPASSAATAWLNLGDVLRDHDQDFPAALAAYRHALSIDPHLRYARDAEGRVFEAMGLIDDAANSYEASIADYPGDEQSYEHLAELILERPMAFPDPDAALKRVVALAPPADVAGAAGP